MNPRRTYSQVYVLAREDGRQLAEKARVEFESRRVSVVFSITPESDQTKDKLEDSLVIFVASPELVADKQAMTVLYELHNDFVRDRQVKLMPIDGGMMEGRGMKFMGRAVIPLEITGSYPEGVKTPIQRVIETFITPPSSLEGQISGSERKG